MQTEEMIPVNEFCSHHNIETSFIYSLQESGLIEISTIHEETFVPVNQLSQLEKLVRLYYEMDINLEGIEAIIHLLECIETLQQEMVDLRKKIGLYE